MSDTSPQQADRPPKPRWGKPAEAPTTLLLVRHGTTEHSHDGRFSGRNNLPLDATGRRQAAAAARLLARTEGAEAVLTSPLRRARETAAVIAAELGTAITVCDDLIEMDFGRWEGLTFAEAERGWPAELAEWIAHEDAAAVGGESFADVRARVSRFSDELRSRYARQRVVAVSHLGPAKVLLRLALGAPHEAIYRLQVETASLSVVDYYADGTCAVKLLNRGGALP